MNIFAKIEQTRTPEDLQKLTLKEFHRLWFIDAMTDRQMAKMFGVTRKDVKKRRKELKLNMLRAGMLYVYGGPTFKEKTLWGKEGTEPKKPKKTRKEKYEDKYR